MSRRRSSFGPGCSASTASTCSIPRASPSNASSSAIPVPSTVVPVHDDGTVSLVRQYRAAVDASVLEIPAGTRDKDGETEEQTARRELAEEAGLEAAHSSSR